MTLDRREEFASLFFSTVILPPSPKNISVACQRLNFVVRFCHLSSGLTITVNNGQIFVSNDNMTRISVYDFEFVNSNGDFNRAMRCQSELMFVGNGGTYGCHVGDGDTPVPCVFPQTEYIHFVDGITRGWSGRRVANKGGRRVHYLWRRSQTPEEGYINCHFYDDINPVLGLYVLYPSE